MSKAFAPGFEPEVGLVMCGDKARQKAYNQAVVEGWSPSAVVRAFC